MFRMLPRPLRLGFAAVAAAVLTLLAVGGVAGTGAGAATPRVTWTSGALSGAGPEQLPAFGKWRGASVKSATDFTAWDNWDLIENPSWDIAMWGPAPGYKLVLSMPMWPNTGGSLAEAATGAYNAHFAKLARNLIAGGMSYTTLRIGWEFNGDWYPWSVRTAAGAANYAAAWRQIIGAIKAVPGQHFGFDWSPTRSLGGVDPALAYPGDAYVTDIGLSVYDWSSTAGQTPAARWNDIVNRGYGLAWQARFAQTHKKPLAFPEWGLAHNAAAPGISGGDDPLFVTNMFNWFASHNVSYENYFNSDTTYGQYYGLTTGNGFFPKAAARYRELF